MSNTLLYVLLSMVVLSVLALGVSAVSPREWVPVVLWIAWWLLGTVFVTIAAETKPWLKYLSFKHDLGEIALAIFRLNDDLKLAQDNIPVLGEMLKNVKPATFEALRNPATVGSIIALALMLMTAVIVLARKVKAE